MTAALRCCVASASLSKRHRFTIHHPPPAIFFLRPSTVLRSPTPLPPLCMAFSTSSSTPIDSPEHETNRNQQLTHVLKYHNETKHSLNNYAKGPRGLDWANQPNPFRRYDSTKLIPLLHPSTLSNSASSNDDVLFNDTAPSYPSLFSSLPSSKPISIATISQLFYDSLALSAWKSTGYSTWSLRVNPSSGNLHPTESYIIAPRIDSVSESPFVAHYAPKEHALEIRAEMESDFFPNLFPENSFLIGLSSVFWREAWKYGERAFRYCNHDVGHAIGAIAIAAAELGWDVRILDGLRFKDLERLMGLDVYNEFKIPSRPVKGSFPEMEFEHPDCVLLVFSNGVANFDVDYRKLSAAIGEFSVLEWKGKPNILSKEHVCWDVIYRTAEVVKKPLLVEDRVAISPFRRSKEISKNCYKELTVREVVRNRRSAVDMDGVSAMERDTFYQILLHCLPTGVCENGEKQGKPCALPFRALSWDAEVHAVLFVYRVVGLPKGLYFLVRNEAQFDDLKKSTRSDFKWVKPEGCPSDLPLYELARGDLQVLAKRISCHQDIAGDGCFSLGMVAHFAPSLQEKGVWMYPRLFWETGLLGQVLYLEAHAVGISATGIGCFFDDAVHEILGLSGSNYQSLYHFTVGGPVLDKRIMSLPAYPGPEA